MQIILPIGFFNKVEDRKNNTCTYTVKDEFLKHLVCSKCNHRLVRSGHYKRKIIQEDGSKVVFILPRFECSNHDCGFNIELKQNKTFKIHPSTIASYTRYCLKELLTLILETLRNKTHPRLKIIAKKMKLKVGIIPNFFQKLGGKLSECISLFCFYLYLNLHRSIKCHTILAYTEKFKVIYIKRILG